MAQHAAGLMGYKNDWAEKKIESDCDLGFQKKICEITHINSLLSFPGANKQPSRSFAGNRKVNQIFFLHLYLRRWLHPVLYHRASAVIIYALITSRIKHYNALDIGLRMKQVSASA